MSHNKQSQQSPSSLVTLDLLSRFIKRWKSSIMSRRSHKGCQVAFDLDDELSRMRPRPPGLSVKKDNWKVSAEKAGRDEDWNETKKGLGLGSSDLGGYWRYSGEKEEKFWIDAPIDSDKNERHSPTLAARFHGPFKSFVGDQQVSQIYRETWLAGDARAFIELIYDRYAENSTIPEGQIWKIWRCLVGELVPSEESWDDAPPEILATPESIWQTGKCIFEIMTKGVFFDNERNILQLVDQGQKFGAFKVAVLHESFSQNLLKFVLSCFAYEKTARPTRDALMKHFQVVLTLFDRGPTEKPVKDPVPQIPPGEAPYQPKTKTIPRGLTQAAGAVYEIITDTVEARTLRNQSMPRIVVVTDLAKDFDDLLAMIVLKELHRLGAIKLEGFIANLYPARKRALLGRGALDSLGLLDVPIGVGTVGEPEGHHEVLPYEFADSESFIAPDSRPLEDGQKLVHALCTRAREGNYKLTCLCLSSLMDIAEFTRNQPDLFKSTFENVVFQGGYNIINGKLEADSTAANNSFSLEDAKYFHEFIYQNKIPSKCFTKVATFATDIYQDFLVQCEATGLDVAKYLRSVQLGQDLHFWKCASGPVEGRFRVFMDETWFLSIKTTWYDTHEFDEPGPQGDAITPYLTKVTAYDCLAAIGASGDDILDALGVEKPIVIRKDAIHPVHKIVGVLPVEKQRLGQEANVDGEAFATAIKSLLLGSLLSVKQGL